ncbi:MAG: hypothetical protein RSB77_05750 [Bacilli bacterium]
MKYIKAKTYYVSILIFTLLGISISLISSFISEYQLLQKVGNEYYSKNAITFNIESNNKNIDVSNMFLLLKKGQVLYKDLGNDTRMIYFNGNKYDIPILNGRTFNKNDLNSSKELVLVGKNRIKEYLNSEVIGEIGLKFSSNLDDFSIIISNKGNEKEPIDGTWIIDGNKGVKYSYSNINEELESLGATIEKTYKDDNSISRLFNNNRINIVMYLSIVLTFISCLLIYMYLIIISKKDDIKTMIICGLNKYEILNECLTKTIIVSSIFYLIGLVLSSFILKYNYSYIVNYKILFITTFFMLAICFIFVFLFFKFCINKYMRRLENDF